MEQEEQIGRIGRDGGGGWDGTRWREGEEWLGTTGADWNSSQGMEKEDGMAQDGGSMRRVMGTRESRLEQ